LARRATLLLVSSTGGHLLQLVALREAFEGFERVWVSFDSGDTRALLAGERVVHAYAPTNRNVPNLVRNLALAVRVIRRVRPVAIVSTGAGVAVPFAWAGRLFRVPFVYVESVTRIDSASLTYRLLAPVATRVYVQWPELQGAVPRSLFHGNVLGA
jgi:beta-1,4-N-acetylglucosaminyltransferase